MNKLLVKLYHIKLRLFGDKELVEQGKYIPCIRCGGYFKSFCSYSGMGYAYYNHCRTCEIKMEAGLI